MSVNPVDRVSPYPPVPHRDDSAGFARRRETSPEAALARHRPPLAGDASARRGRPLPPEIAFLAAHGAPLVMLQYGATLARRQGARADAVLIAEGMIPRALLSHSGDGAARSLSRDAACARALGEPRAGRRPRLRSPRRGAARPALAVRAARRGDPRLVGVTRSSAGRPLFAIAAPSIFEAALRRSSARRLAEFRRLFGGARGAGSRGAAGAARRRSDRLRPRQSRPARGLAVARVDALDERLDAARPAVSRQYRPAPLCLLDARAGGGGRARAGGARSAALLHRRSAV